MGANQQMTFNWATPPPVPKLEQPPLPETPMETSAVCEPTTHSLVAAVINRSIELPWDFQSTFPQPLPGAIDAGKFGDDEVTAEKNASVHAEHANECLAVLDQLDAIEDAKRTGIDPRTGGMSPISTTALS